MGCCFSRKKRCMSPGDIQVQEIELNRRYNALIANENGKRSVEITRDYVKSPSLTSLDARLDNLLKPIEENLDSDEDEKEKEEGLENDIESLDNRLRALCSNSPVSTTSLSQTLNKKDMSKLRLAEEKLLEFEERLAELQKPIMINGVNCFSVT